MKKKFGGQNWNKKIKIDYNRYFLYFILFLFFKIKIKKYFRPLGFKLRVSNVGSPACDNNV